MSTGKIAHALIRPIVLAKVADPEVKRWLTTAAANLSAIAISRNGVLHARPATVNGEQRLNRWDPSRKEVYVVDTDRIRAIISDIDSRLRKMSAIRLPFKA